MQAPRPQHYVLNPNNYVVGGFILYSVLSSYLEFAYPMNQGWVALQKVRAKTVQVRDTWLLMKGWGKTGRCRCSYRRTDWVWEKNRLKFRTSGKLPTSLEEYMEYSLHQWRKTEKTTKLVWFGTGLGLGTLGYWPLMPQKSPRTLLVIMVEPRHYFEYYKHWIAWHMHPPNRCWFLRAYL